MKKVLTLSYVINGNKVLLGYKKKGFGQGRWNGFGGKVELEENIESAAKREIKEECGLEISELISAGIIEFKFVIQPADVLEVHIFRAKKYIGQVIESEEMKPQWFDFDKVPYEEMWDDDQYWFPSFLEGKSVKGEFLFDADDKVIKKELNIY